jgi:hypothetical protein
MRRSTITVFAAAIVLGLLLPVQAGQTLLTAFAPANSDGTRVLLKIDWELVLQAAPDVEMVMIRRRPAGLPVAPDTVAFLNTLTAQFEDTGLNPEGAYHYYAYFKTADSSTTKFGSFPAIAHLGPIHTLAKR